jgi:hypothetical protein
LKHGFWDFKRFSFDSEKIFDTARCPARLRRASDIPCFPSPTILQSRIEFWSFSLSNSVLESFVPKKYAAAWQNEIGANPFEME